jgi:glucose-6-phosphate isomerase
MQNLHHYITRIREHDATLWSDDPVVQAEIAQRLGWTTLPEQAPVLYPLLDRLANMADERNITDVVLIGMGGSSLASYVFGQTYQQQCARRLHVLDTTCPTEVMALARTIDFKHTLFIVASKSGTTLETITLEELFWHLVSHDIADDTQRAAHFIAITDPETPLAIRAQKRGYTWIASPPDVGGRFSALSVFGLVSCALIGIDCRTLIDEAIQAQHLCETPDDTNPAVRLATELWCYYQAGNDKLPLPDVPLSVWLGQLIAESLGKCGQGIVPLIHPLVCCCGTSVMPCPDSTRSCDDPVLAQYGGLQHCYQSIEPDVPVSVVRSMVVWQWAIALLGILMGVNPFDQPNVASAKKAILKVLENGAEPPETLSVDEVLASAQPQDYLCLLAYVDNAQYRYLKDSYVPYLVQRTGLPVCLEQGPRYLHSIGQLHEGGPNTGIFIVIDNETPDTPNVILPQVDYTLREFFDAQRTGDINALRSAGRRVAMLNMSDIVEGR